MTQNQLTYQQNVLQNKLREEENAIKAREAAVKEHQEMLATSGHLHDYGYIEVPNQGSMHQWGSKETNNQSGAKINSHKNKQSSAQLLTGIGNLIKSVFSPLSILSNFIG
jgi:hypothetical protein